MRSIWGLQPHYTNPVDRIPRCDTRPRETRIILSFQPRILPLFPPELMHLRKLRQAPNIRTPAKIINNEPLDPGGLCGVNHGGLMADTSGSHDADRGVLALQGLRESLGGVVDFEYRYTGREGRGGFGARDNGDLKVGLDEGRGDGAAEVAGGLLYGW